MKPAVILKFSWRYFRAKKSTQAINVISWVSVVAIMFGTASLITILSAFNGFESLVKSLYSSFYPDMRVGPAMGKTMLLTPEQLQSIRGIPGVETVSLTAECKALLQNERIQVVADLKGVDDAYEKVSGVSGSMYRGKYILGDTSRPGLVLGIGLEQSLGLLSDRTVYPIAVYIPKKTIASLSDPLQALSLSEAFPQGSFAIQSDFDNRYVLTDLGFIRSQMGFGKDEYSSLEIRLQANVPAGVVAEKLSARLGKGYKIEDRYQQNSMLFSTIRLEKLAIYAIFSLILIVAAFNMIGSLSMLVIEKRKDIMVLKSMGATEGTIQGIFLTEGMLLSFIGALAGMAIALLFYYLQTTYKLIPLEGSTFLVDHYPVKLVGMDFLLVGMTVFIISLSASWWPSRKASRQPLELKS